MAGRIHSNQQSHSILVIGASVRAATHSLCRGGFRSMAADLFADSDLPTGCRFVRMDEYSSGLVDVVKEFGPDAWMYTGGLENAESTVNLLAQLSPLYGIAGTALRCCRDPISWTALVREAGHAHVPEVSLSPPNSKTASFRWLKKKLHSGGGRGVEFWDGHPDPAPGCFYQQFVSGVPYGAVFIGAERQCRLVGVCQQLVGIPWCSQRFHYAGSVGPVRLSDHIVQTISSWGTVLTSRLDLRGLFGIDFILCEGESWPIEINPRYTASVELHERSTGWSSAREHVRAFALAPECDNRPAHNGTQSLVGKLIAYASRDIEIEDSFAKFVAQKNDGCIWPVVSDIPIPGTLVGAGQPICTVFADGKSVDDISAQLLELSRQITRLTHGAS